MRGPHEVTGLTRHPGVLLLEETDPSLRLVAHLELGRRAKARDDIDTAETHFREARALDPLDERPRAELRGLGRLQRGGFLKSWWSGALTRG
ncbi:MAG: hypothetical protein R3F61_07130 [Myxococcota bacterium]